MAGAVPPQQRLGPHDPAVGEVARSVGRAARARRARWPAGARLEIEAAPRPAAASSWLNSSMRARPRSLARYMAASASRSSCSADDPAPPPGRCPRWRSRRAHGPTARSARAARPTMRSANSTASLASAMSSRTITNSSPPKRATVSDAADRAGEATGDFDEQLVADDVTEPVVHELEAVEVEEQHRDAGRRCVRHAPASARGGRPAADGSGGA